MPRQDCACGSSPEDAGENKVNKVNSELENKPGPRDIIASEHDDPPSLTSINIEELEDRFGSTRKNAEDNESLDSVSTKINTEDLGDPSDTSLRFSF
ncbi:hypothetical protein ElyMa_005938900 [Elysia marginata]|uniref:CTNNB1 binding N-teminal domain-containing protein n=1 Tax=Elysia marginata TaxID=1093978 RepID=A0AAV4G8E3_9GAST|nr:hypothetical protein ElyMa_005938900 [Elysia marginata]